MIQTRVTVNLTPRQTRAMNRLTDRETKYILFGGAAGGGKSFLSAVWMAGVAQNFADTRFFVGRDELKRLRDSWLMTFYKLMKMVGCSEFKYNAFDHYIQFYNNSRIDLLDLKYLPSDPLYERYGSVEYTSGTIEEGSEVSFAAFDTLKTRVGRWNNDKHNLPGKILTTANPKKNWLYKTFYLPTKTGLINPQYAFIPALATENPYLDSVYHSNLDAITDKVTKERLKYGNWEYDDTQNALIQYDTILNLFTNNYVPGGKRYITADIARFGVDRTVIGQWNGYRLERIVVLNKSSITESAKVIQAMATVQQIPMSNVIVDEDGVGGGVMDLLACRGFINNARPVEIQGGKYNYANLKSQCTFLICEENINQNQVYINAKDEHEKEEIIEELEQLRDATIDVDKKKAVVSKDKVKDIIGRSPDYSDMIIMRKWFDLPHASKIKGWTSN